MNLNHLTDSELIQWIIKHDDDPIRVRLALYMDNMPGRILDGLERAGMDPETCLHENIYESGEYITHLNNEIEYLQRELDDTQEQLRKRETLTVAQLIEELHQDAYQARQQASAANRDRDQMEREVIETRKKMKVWRAISTDLT